MNELIQYQQEERIESVLSPLAAGQPVALKIHDSGVIQRLRTFSPNRDTTLYIIPMMVLGEESDRFMFVLGDKSRILKLDEPWISSFYLMGLPVKAARALMTELKRQFVDKTVGD